MQKATRNQTGLLKRRLVLKTIHDSGQPFRARIARLTRLARTIVSGVFADSRVRELVEETGHGPPASGESPIFPCAIDHSRHVIGVDLALDPFRGAVIKRQVDAYRNDCGRGESTFHASAEGLSCFHLGPGEGGAYQRQEVLSAV
jgi:hypothetical protein